MEFNYTKACVDDYGQEIISKMIAILKASGSKKLFNEIRGNTELNIDSIMYEIKMPEHGYYASEGRNPGRFPPLTVITDWMESRGIDLALQYPISRKIASLGTKASAKKFIDEFQITSEFEKNLISEYSKDIILALTKAVDDLNSK